MNLSDVREEVRLFLSSKQRRQNWPRSLRERVMTCFAQQTTHKSLASFASDLGVDVHLLYNWRKFQKMRPSSKGATLSVVHVRADTAFRMTLRWGRLRVEFGD